MFEISLRSRHAKQSFAGLSLRSRRPSVALLGDAGRVMVCDHQNRKSFKKIVDYYMVVKEKTLLKIAFTCAVVGVIALFFISQTIEIGEKEINKITEANVGDVVLLKGNVDRISHSEKVDFLK